MAKLLSQQYEIKHTVGTQTALIYVQVDSDNNVTVLGKSKHPQHVFNVTHPDKKAAVAKAFQEAADLVNIEKDMDVTHA